MCHGIILAEKTLRTSLVRMKSDQAKELNSKDGDIIISVGNVISAGASSW